MSETVLPPPLEAGENGQNDPRKVGIVLDRGHPGNVPGSVGRDFSPTAKINSPKVFGRRPWGANETTETASAKTGLSHPKLPKQSRGCL